MGSRKTWTVDAMRWKRREGLLQHCPLSYDQARCIHPPFVECYAVQAFSIASDFDPKLMPKNHNEKSLHRQTIPFFMSSKSPFWLQLRLRETPLASHPETKAKRCPRRNKRRAARAVWLRCEPSTPRRDSRTGELTCSRKRRAQPFLPSHCRSERNQACLLGQLWSSSRERATRSVQAAQSARTRNCSRSPKLAPNSNGSGPPPPSSRAAHWERPRRSPPLVSDTVISGTVKGHWNKEGYEEPYGIRGQMVFRPSTYVDFRSLGLIEGEEKSYSPFVSTPLIPTRIGPSMLVFQRASGSPDRAYPNPYCLYVECMSVYEPSAFDIPRVIWRRSFGRGSTDNR